jgi:hypothetical protein
MEESMNRFAFLIASLHSPLSPDRPVQDAGKGTVKFSGGSLRPGIGCSWGDGVLNFNGTTSVG